MRIVSWIFLFFFAINSHSAQANEELKLLARSHEALTDTGLTSEEWRWIHKHRKINLAVWLPMSPPYDITTGLNDYGGINADYLGIVANSLGVEIGVIRYSDYSSALEALRQGKADLIAQAGDNQLKDGMLLSTHYSRNEVVEVLNTDAEGGTAPAKIAVASTYDSRLVAAHYPNTQIVTFHSSRHAMEALAFRQIDLFVCDEITARYLISQSNLSNLRIRSSDHSLSHTGFSFAVMPKNKIWINVLNKVLKAVPESSSVEIHRRWNGGIPLSLSEQQTVYTSLERKWIKEHNHIRVAVAQDNAPVAWFNESGHLRGIIADILIALRLRTGLNFDIQVYPSQRAALTAVKEGKADLVAGGIQDEIWLSNLITTRTWLYNSWVMVGRSADGKDAPGRSVVSLDGQSPNEWLRQQTQGMNSKVITWRQGLDRVVKGESDMMAMPLIVANNLLASKEYTSLRILERTEIDPMRYSFGASEQSGSLITILNKALINIPPEDLHALTRGNNADNGFTTVSTSISLSWPLLVFCLVAALLLILTSGYYAWRLRHRLCLHNIDTVPFPMFVSDSRGVIKHVNQAFCEALSVSRESAEDIFFTEIFGSEALFKNDVLLRHGERVLRIWQIPLGPEKGYVGGWRDETRQYNVIKMLHKRKQRAEEISREKSEFLITMSHEIRTPLSAILGMLELVMKRPEDSQQNTISVQVAWDAAQSLLQLVGNILDVSRIEAGRLTLRPQRVALRGLIEEAALLFEGMATQKGLTFELEIDAEIHDDVLADRSRLRQILVNLVGNAIKYTDCGRIALRIEMAGKEGGYLLLQINVEDSGPGIDEKTCKQLFQPFTQGENSPMVQGSGLGLYITRNLAQMMGGTIELQSEPGKGTVAKVILRLLVMTPQALPKPALQDVRGGGPLNILVVEDNPAGRMLLIEQLRCLGHHACGAETLDQVLACVESLQPDVIFTDFNMPGVNGLDLTKLLLARRPETIIFGITADAREAVRATALRAGMRDCLFKPVTLSVLSDLLNSSVPLNSPAATIEWSDKPNLPLALLDGENLKIFLTLQISVIDETLHQLERWHQSPETPLNETLHKLRGGFHLLGISGLTALCEEQEKAPQSEGIRRLESQLMTLRDALTRWRDSGLQPHQTVLQNNKEVSVS